MNFPLLFAAALTWLAPQDAKFTINGLPWLAENKGELIRLPRRLEAELPKPVWNLGLSPSGGRIRFRTNSTQIAIRVEYPSPPNMANMHAFGQTGVDLYIDGSYRSTAIAPKDAEKGKTVEHVFFANAPKQSRDITLYLPLYKPANVISIGVDDDAAIERPRRFSNPKPVVFYGTSITQGGCASRSGLSYQAILARRLNLDFVNLGFSGNGKGEPVVAGMVAELDASLFILDFSQNNPNIDALREVYEPFLNTVRAKHPDTPIVAITPIASADNSARFQQYREHIREVVNRRIASGDKRLTLVEGYSLLGPSQLDGLVDGVHPNDLGFQWMADGLAPTIAKTLNLPPPVLVNDSKIAVTPETAAAMRKQLIDFIWGPAGFPAFKPVVRAANAPSPIKSLKNAAQIEALEIRMEAGQTNTTYHLIPKQKFGQLIVLHHGHSCSFDDGAGLAEAADSFLGAGYSVLLAHMPHMRPGDCQTVPHGDLFNLPLKSGNALKFFLEPVAYSLNLLKPDYKEINMVGLSGGGWTTTLYAALDPGIRVSFPVAGTIPLYLRSRGSIGDKEQYLDEFYQLAGYQDLYVLGATGAGRRQVQILNRKDNCCFGEAQHNGNDYEPAMRVYEKRVRQAIGDKGSFRLVIDDDAPKHMISPQAVDIMLRELAK
ncbi:MAG: SGNH/GDSL hydrolase family protein [Acidobacteria bacterium]|nr:SGNH/GDSL hydrolase family protein [Acidobacteriota bacterium]